MPTDFTVVDSAGQHADYRLEAESTPSAEEIARLFSAIGLHRPPASCPQPGAVLGREQPEEPAARTSTELRVICGPDAGSVIGLTNGITTIGRDDRCTLTLTDPGVSRQHLEIEVSPRRMRLRQFAVVHRARVDGKRIAGPIPIGPGAMIRIANTVLRVSDPASPEPPDSPGVPQSVEFPTAPTRRHHQLGLAAALVSCLAGALAAATTRSVELLVMAALPALGLVVVSLGSRSSQRRAHRRGEQGYRAALASARESLAQACASEAAQRHRDSPDPASLEALGNDARDAGLCVRLGLGRQPAAVEVRRGTEAPKHPPLRDVPVCADLADGVLAFCGPLPLARAQARWALCQLAHRHGVWVTLWLSHDAEAEWTWARWLPQLHNVHVGDSMPDTSPGRGQHVFVIDHPDADTRDVRPFALIVTGNPRVPVASVQATVPVDDTGLSQLLARTACDPLPFTADLVSADFAERWSRSLAGSWRAAPTGPVVPEKAALLDLLGLGPMPDAAAIVARWQVSPETVRMPIGLGATGVVEIDLDRDGPHALIAGTTGSGKSELLQTMVLGLAARYRPEAVQFLLVDYKGGAAFGHCADLPHTAGVVTDLDAQQTSRALRSLRAELRRREVLLASAAAADFTTFHRRGVDAPLPRLVVVVDEFATLTAELPDFVTGLVGIAQRGRSLGMHLVLATQRPAGVVSPEIRANANLRIALRTISPAESIDVIDRPDAAALDPGRPGRAYRGGIDLEQFQVARISGGSTRTTSGATTLTRLGPWRRPLTEAITTASDQPVDGTVLVSQLVVAAQQAKVVRPPAPWLPPLASTIPAHTLRSDERTRIAVGLIDLPDEQRQDCLTFDLDAGGSVGIAGGPRSGRSTALLTAASAGMTQLGVDELHVHVLDFGGGTLQVVSDLPHRGTAVDARDPVGFVGTLVAHLEVELARRRRGARTTPYILVLIDDWPALTAAVDTFDLGATSERLRRLLPRCRGTGVTVVLTGDQSVLHPRLGSILDARFALAFSDPSLYSMVGIAHASVPGMEAPGRGLRVTETAEIQFAVPATPNGASGRPSRPTQPGRIELRSLPSFAPREARPTRGGHVCLGLGGDSAEPIWLSLESMPSLLVAGPRRSGRTTLLCGLLEQAVADGRSVAAVAPERSPLRAQAKEHHQMIVDEPGDLRDHDLVLVDDAEQFDGTALAEVIEQRLQSATPGLIAAARTDAALTAFRGLTAELRRAGHGIVLQPDTLDAELVGVRLARNELGGPPGRGIAVGEPTWGWPQPLEHPQWLSIQTWGGREPNAT